MHLRNLTAAGLIATMIAGCGGTAGVPVKTTVAPGLEASSTSHSVTPSTRAHSTSTSTTRPTTTSTSAPANGPASGEYTTAGKPFHLYEPESATHIVVLLHGLNTPLPALAPLAQQFSADGAHVLVPVFDLAIAPDNRAAEAAQVACAVAFGSSLDESLPLVLVGFSGGGLHAGLYVATAGSHWDASICVADTPPRPLTGFVLLDGPVDDPGWREAVGMPPNDRPDAHLWDPVTVATPNPEISGAYFISGDLPDYAWAAMDKFNAALDIDGPITELPTSHAGLISGTFSEIPVAVLDVAGLGASGG